MNLQPADIDTIEDAGLRGQPVKLCRTRGGFWMGIHKGKVIAVVPSCNR